ncbi:MAG: dihydroorotate dehydrogenase electron transfer subunit [Candidatus Bathyarchaeia archaeon]
MSTETRRIVHVKDVREENDRVRTLTFTDPLCASGQPGQYLMVWAPEVDEVPMSISNATERGEASVTVEAVGEATCALCRMKVGDRIGVMGPLGRGFTPHAGEVVMVAGGIGVIPLAFLAERLIHLSSRISFILGARTRERLVFTSRLESAFSGRDDRLIVTTEDGSLGRRGTAVDALHELLAKSRPDFLYACGPDVMLAKVFRLTENHKIPMEASLQAYVKCAVGLCGSCCIGPYLLCRDGPVFSEVELRQMPELGLFRRDAAGARVPLA